MEISYLKQKYPFLRNIFLRIIPFLTVLLLLLIIWAGILYYFTGNNSFGYFVSVLFVILYTWWVIRWIEYIIFVIWGILRYKNFQKLNLDNIVNWKPINKQEKLIYDKYKKSDLKVNEVYHWIIIPTYKDPLEMLNDTFESIKHSNVNLKNVFITLAWEYSDRKNFTKIKEFISSKYKDTFWFLNFTLHKLVPWELQWKGSNVSYAIRTTFKEILNYAPAEKIMVHIMDSESIVQDRYFLSMWLEFCLTDSMRHNTIYQPMLFLLNRFEKAPYFSKIIALSVGTYILGASIKGVGVRAQAVQAQSLKSLIDTNFYSVESITEDWHQYYRTYCTFNWKFQVKPVYSYVLLEPVIGKNIIESLILQYNQIKRWAHWCMDLPYILLCFIDKFKKLPKLRTLYEIFWLTEASVLWGSLQFILFFWSIFLISVFNYFSWVFIVFNFITLLILVVILFISYWFFLQINNLNKVQLSWELFKYSILSFTLMWPILLILNWLPALHAQLMILFWKPLGSFNVTKKYR